MNTARLEAFDRLLNIMEELRMLCPWDKEQTFESLRCLTIEETYELSEAILSENYDNISKELGDVLLHIVFYAQMGYEKKLFDITDVINQLCSKLIYRHPHIYSNTQANDSSTVVKNWEQLKSKEKDGNKTVLSGVPSGLTSLIKAKRIQDKAAAVGFDWDEREQVWDKVQEEINELQHEIKLQDQQKMEAEFGDVLFSLVNAARLYGIDPDTALEKTNKKFINRFNYLETQTIKKGKNLHDMSLDEMNTIWDEAKLKEKNADDL